MDRNTLAILTVIAVFLFSSTISFAQTASDDKTRRTGLIITKEERDYIHSHWKRVQKVHLNKLGKQRIIDALRANKAASPSALSTIIREGNIAPDDKDLEGAIDAPSTNNKQNPIPSAMSTLSTSASDSLPDAVDNSKTVWFPPIADQGSLGSCAAFATGYYQLSYAQARDKNIAINLGDKNHIYSPKFFYNLTNNGNDTGTYYSSIYSVMEQRGGATWQDFPYDNNYRAWPLNAQVWRNALSARTIMPMYISWLHTDDGLLQLKQLLNNGHLVTISTNIFNWQYRAIKNNPFTAQDDPYIGEAAGYYVGGTGSSAHAMTIVGYNDNLWIDINGNGVVDSGELGALKIANSWGGSWRNKGFVWLAYDALKLVSVVSGGPTKDRETAFIFVQGSVLLVRSNYSPKLIGQFTVNQAKRNTVRFGIGTSATNSTTPTLNYSVNVLDGGPYAFDGSTVSVDGNFVIDYSDLVPADSAKTRFYLRTGDMEVGNPTTIKSFKLIDTLTQNEVAASGLPKQFDKANDSTFESTVDATVDYTYNADTFVLTTSASHGTIARNPNQQSYVAGSSVKLTAVPDQGYAFVAWQGDIAGTVNPVDVIMNSNHSISAAFKQVNKAPVVNAGPDQVVLPTATVALTGTASDDGLQSGQLKTEWSMVTGPGAVTFGDPSQLKTTVAFTSLGTYALRLTAYDGELSSFDDALITVRSSNTFSINLTPSDLGVVSKSPDQPSYAPGTRVTLTATPAKDYLFSSWSGSFNSKSNPVKVVMNSDKTITANFVHVNAAPVVNAGGNQTIQLPELAQLSGAAEDDGYPSRTLQVTWKKVSGPGAVKFKDSHSLTTQASFSTGGVYVLSLTANDGKLHASSEVTITAIAEPTYTITLLSPNGSIKKSPDRTAYTAGTKVTLRAVPNSGYKFGSWGGGYVDGTSSVTTITIGKADVRVHAYFVQINKAPVVSAGPAQKVALSAGAVLAGTATDDALPLPAEHRLGVQWSKKTGKGEVVFNDSKSLNTSVRFSAAGVYVLKLTVSDGELQSTSLVTITVTQ